LRAIEILRAQHIQKLDARFEFETGLTDLRLYRMAIHAGSKNEADEYMRDAQREATKLGWADTSSAALARLIEASKHENQKSYKRKKKLAKPHLHLSANRRRYTIK
jgi:hypothetical protein